MRSQTNTINGQARGWVAGVTRGFDSRRAVHHLEIEFMKTIDKVSVTPDIKGQLVTIFYSDFTKLAVTVDKPARVFASDIALAIEAQTGCELKESQPFMAEINKVYNP